MSSESRWRPALSEDLDAIMTIQAEVHGLLPESREIFGDKMRHCGEGCMMLSLEGNSVGYGVAHPWVLRNIPSLDALLGALPDKANCLFIHDVALLPQARGRGAGGSFVKRMSMLARDLDLPALALVSVYGTFPMWEKCGFTTQASGPLADKLAGYGSTARYMVATLGSSEALR